MWKKKRTRECACECESANENRVGLQSCAMCVHERMRSRNYSIEDKYCIDVMREAHSSIRKERTAKNFPSEKRNLSLDENDFKRVPSSTSNALTYQHYPECDVRKTNARACTLLLLDESRRLRLRVDRFFPGRRQKRRRVGREKCVGKGEKRKVGLCGAKDIYWVDRIFYFHSPIARGFPAKQRPI